MSRNIRAAFCLVSAVSIVAAAITPAHAEQNVSSSRGYRLVVPDGWLVRNLDSAEATLAAPDGAALPVRCVVRVVRDSRNFPMADSPEGFRRFNWRGWLDRFAAREGLRVMTTQLAPNQPLHLAMLSVDPSRSGGRDVGVVHGATVRFDTLYSLSCFVPTQQLTPATATLNAIFNSFVVSGPPGAPPRTSTTVCPSELGMVREPEVPFACTCTAEHTRSGTVWGTDTYTADSHICRAALHAGVIGADGGALRLQRVAGLTAYPGSRRNGIESLSYGQYGASLRFLETTTAAGQTAPPAAAPSTPPAAPVQAPPPSAPPTAAAPSTVPAAGTTQLAPCPETGQGLQQPTACLCTAARAQSGRSIWGTDIYTDDSNVCSAALHAGAIGRQGGAVRVTPLPGQQAYAPSERNGVVSSPYARWDRSFGVANAAASGVGQPSADAAGGKAPAGPTEPHDRALCDATAASVQSHRDRIAACTRLIDAGATGTVLRDALNGRGMSERLLDQREAALQDFSRVLELDPQFAAGYFNRALVHADAGRSEEALRNFDRAIELAPNQARPHVERAFLLAAMGEHAQALGGFARTIELDARAANAFYGRGLVLTALSRYEEAGRDFDRALELQPDAPPVLVARAFNALALGRREAGLADIQREVLLSNRAPASLMNRAAAWVLLRDSASAVLDYERVVEVSARDGMTHNLRCFALAMLGRAADAMASCDEAVRLRPNDADPLRTRGYALLRLGRPDAALVDYDRALTLAPHSGTGLYGRAVARTRAGDSAGGQRDREAALRLDPQVQRRPAWVWLDYDPRSGVAAPSPPTLTPSIEAPSPAPAK